jgi:hypothetical protein
MLRIGFALALVGCAITGPAPAPAPAPAATTPAPIALTQPWGVPGETIEYAASVRGLAVGRAVTAVGREGEVEGRGAIIVRSRGQSTGMIALLAELTWELQTTIALDTGAALDSREESTAVIAGEARNDVRTVAGGAYDLHSAIAVVRGWRSLPGQTAKLAVTFGYHTLDATLRDAGHGYLASAREPAVRYEGVVEDKVKFTAWVSDDVARVPLRFECELERFGRLVVDLVHYSAPSDGP